MECKREEPRTPPPADLKAGGVQGPASVRRVSVKGLGKPPDGQMVITKVSKPRLLQPAGQAGPFSDSLRWACWGSRRVPRRRGYG